MKSAEAVAALNRLEQKLLDLSGKIDKANMVALLDGLTFYPNNQKKDKEERTARKKAFTKDIEDVQSYIAVTKLTVQENSPLITDEYIEDMVKVAQNRFDWIQATYDSMARSIQSHRDKSAE